MIILGDHGSIHRARSQNPTDDAIRVQGSFCTVTECAIRDSKAAHTDDNATKAHKDAIQLVPSLIGYNHIQYAAGELVAADISGNVITADTSLQAILGTDGVFSDLLIQDNVIDIASPHTITFNGLLDARIYNNKDRNGNLVPVNLNPLRVGGGVMHNTDFCVWVIGFSTCSGGAYGAIQTDAVVHDFRQCIDPKRPNDYYLTDFRLTDYQDTARDLCDQGLSIEVLIPQLKQLAFDFGTCVQQPRITA